MPCESCQAQFTVFRRKRICQDCKLFYCNNCVINCKRDATLCRRCAVFAKRPLHRDDLSQLKVRDLIFYLQTKKVSTAGCVEKEELVSLVLIYVTRLDGNQYSPTGQDGAERKPEEPHAFDNIKQSCQSFLSNISVSLADSLSSMDARAKSKADARRQSDCRSATSDHNSAHISERQRTSISPPSTSVSFAQEQASNAYITPTTTQMQPNADVECANAVSDDCECSEEEGEDDPIAIFNDRGNKHHPEEAGITASASSSNTLISAANNPNILKPPTEEDSSHSSFEELGAIGGISDDSKAATDTNSSSNTEQWQILDNIKEATALEEDASVSTKERPDMLWRPTAPVPTIPQRSKKVTRRRSDSYLTRHFNSSDEESIMTEQAPGLQVLHEQPEPSAATHQALHCQRCGKNKSSIRKHVERMRQHLESSQMTEHDIKKELEEFLSYLEQRTKSMECSDNESRALSSLSGPEVLGSCFNADALRTPTIEFSPTTESPQVFGDSGGANAHELRDSADVDSRFVNIQDIDDFKDLETLTVKQLKEVLTLHRVDYKGCCEKQEILERVELLRKTLRSAPAVENLATDELCKICMDAPIECVFLECGHMATCTNCGKVLNECPICRQYIIRVVRFFRA